jgi:hypothetical protein
MIYESEFWNYYDASMTRNELTDIICPLNFVNVGMPRWFYDLECNSRLWIVTQIWYMSPSFVIIVMPRWPEMNLRILFVLLNFAKVGMPRWFYDLECNSRLWIVTSVILQKFWNYYDSSITWKELTDVICPIKFCKCWDASMILKKTTFCKCWDALVILWSWVQF